MLGGKIRLMVLAALIAAEAHAGQARPGVAQASPPAHLADVSKLAREAREALNQGDTETAIRDYRQLVKLSPAAADYRLNLGIAYLSSERSREAVEAFEQALKIKPSLAAARDYLAAGLAESGRCDEAIPQLLKSAPHISDPQLKRTVEADGLKCSMALDQEDAALSFLHLLRRDFPKDPEVLYLTVHVYSDLSTRASQRLLTTAPRSYQVHLLDAEILEMQEKWDEAEAEYRRVLVIDPHLPGIHFRIGRLLLTRPKTPTTAQDARREFEEELKVNPGNAGAEYVLGELARQARDWPQAIEHFTHVTALDPNFVDAFIGLGKSLVSAGRVAEAIAPLEDAVKLQPENPVAHYQLAFAYRRAGRAQDADKELVAYKEANNNAHRALLDIRSAVTGQQTPAQTAEPPE